MLFDSTRRQAMTAIALSMVCAGTAYGQTPARTHAHAIYSAPSPDTLATIRQQGELRIGVAPAEPMAMHGKEGSLVGYSVDLGTRLARDIGVRARFIETSWPRLIEGLKKGEYDLIASGIWVTSARALAVNFSAPTVSEGIHLIAGKNTRGKSRAAFDRADITIAVYADTPQADLASRLFPKAKRLMVDGAADQLTPVLEGKAHAALVPTINPELLVSRSKGRLSMPLIEPLARTHAAFAIRKGDADFLNYLNTWLMLQRESGWLDERLHYWNNQLAE